MPQANGHGTVIFGETMAKAILSHREKLEKEVVSESEGSEKEKIATTRLVCALQLINQVRRKVCRPVIPGHLSFFSFSLYLILR